MSYLKAIYCYDSPKLLFRHGVTRLQNQGSSYQKFQTEHIKPDFLLLTSNVNKSQLHITT